MTRTLVGPVGRPPARRPPARCAFPPPPGQAFTRLLAGPGSVRRSVHRSMLGACVGVCRSVRSVQECAECVQACAGVLGAC